MLGGCQVDFKTNPISFQDELDHATTFSELGHVADGQNGLSINSFDNFGEAYVLSGTKEENLAIVRFLRRGDSLGDYTFARYLFSGKRGLERRAKRVLPENTDCKRVALGCHCLGRPLDEPAKVIEIGSLHLKVSWL